MVIVGVLLGIGLGFGAWLCLRALAPRPRAIPVIFGDLERPRPSVADLATVDRRHDLVAYAAEAARRAVESAGLPVPSAAALELTDRTPARHALSKVVAAMLVLGGLNVAALGVASVGIGGPAGALAALSIPAAAAGFVVPDVLAREEANRRRRGFRHALSAYLDLVNILLAGGAGIETALWAAADAGDGWGFARIRGALHRSRLTGQSPWDTFASLGHSLDVAELTELASSIKLAGSHGSRIRASLAAKADTLRGHQLAETEATAESATERMTVPLAVFLAGFLLFIAFPAVQQITGTTGGGLQP